MHGGGAPQVLAKAERRLTERRALATVGRMGIAVDVEPGQALLQQVFLAAGMVEYLRVEVGGLERAFYLARALGLDAIDGTTEVFQAKPHVLVELYGEWTDRLARYAKLALDAGIAERQVRIAERHGLRIADAVRALLDDPELALTSEQREVGRTVAARILRSLAGS